MARFTREPGTETASTLRRLAARRDRQVEALAETREELGTAIYKAIKDEGAGLTAVARLVGLHPTTIWHEVSRYK